MTFCCMVLPIKLFQNGDFAKISEKYYRWVGMIAHFIKSYQRCASSDKHIADLIADKKKLITIFLLLLQVVAVDHHKK